MQSNYSVNTNSDENNLENNNPLNSVYVEKNKNNISIYSGLNNSQSQENNEVDNILKKYGLNFVNTSSEVVGIKQENVLNQTDKVDVSVKYNYGFQDHKNLDDFKNKNLNKNTNLKQNDQKNNNLTENLQINNLNISPVLEVDYLMNNKPDIDLIIQKIENKIPQKDLINLEKNNLFNTSEIKNHQILEFKNDKKNQFEKVENSFPETKNRNTTFIFTKNQILNNETEKLPLYHNKLEDNHSIIIPLRKTHNNAFERNKIDLSPNSINDLNFIINNDTAENQKENLLNLENENSNYLENEDLMRKKRKSNIFTKRTTIFADDENNNKNENINLNNITNQNMPSKVFIEDYDKVEKNKRNTNIIHNKLKLNTINLIDEQKIAKEEPTMISYLKTELNNLANNLNQIKTQENNHQNKNEVNYSMQNKKSFDKNLNFEIEKLINPKEDNNEQNISNNIDGLLTIKTIPSIVLPDNTKGRRVSGYMKRPRYTDYLDEENKDNKDNKNKEILSIEQNTQILKDSDEENNKINLINNQKINIKYLQKDNSHMNSQITENEG